MRSHVVFGQLGSADNILVPSRAGEQVTPFPLLTPSGTIDFGIGRALEQLGSFGFTPTDPGLDLLFLAAHVHAADTRISRATESQDGWTREIRLVVPVNDPNRWGNAEPVLVRMLNFLTGDRWTIQFRALPENAHVLLARAQRLLRTAPVDSLALFSGGLDSLIHAINRLEEGRTPLLVSHSGDSATSNAQKELLTRLKQHYPDRAFRQLRLSMVFPDGMISGVGSEDTTRGRSFLFFSLGVLAGTALGRDFTLEVPENGLIALNVPLDPLRLGALSTRTTHPFYIARWNELLGKLEIPGKIENPCWHQTKGEMAMSCKNTALLGQLAPFSLSCSSPAKGRWLGHGTEHCGYCLPCLIRRAALHHGLGPGQDATTYTLTLGNLQSRPLDCTKAEGVQIRSFQFAIERLRARPGLADILIHKPGSLSDGSADDLPLLADVYRRGLEEVGQILAGVRTQPG